MYTLSQDDIFINEEVKNKIISNPEAYQENLNILQTLEENPSVNPLMNYVYQIINNYDKLMIALGIIDQKEEFTINAYYFFISKIEYYEASGLQEAVAKEKAREDLLDVFNGYEKNFEFDIQ